LCVESGHYLSCPLCAGSFDLSVESLTSFLYSLLQVTYGHHTSIDNVITFMNAEPAVSDASFIYTYRRKLPIYFILWLMPIILIYRKLRLGRYHWKASWGNSSCDPISKITRVKWSAIEHLVW
jgi:hypothetical protein